MYQKFFTGFARSYAVDMCVLLMKNIFYPFRVAWISFYQKCIWTVHYVLI